MRRRPVTFIVVIFFILWNFITYMFLANKQPNKDVDERHLELEAQFSELQRRLKGQAQEHDNVLQELQLARDDVIHLILNRRGIAEKITGLQTRPTDFPPQERNEIAGPLLVLVMACNRVTVSRTIDQLLAFRPSSEKFPIIVSQDCGHLPTAEVIASYGDKLVHIQHPDLSDIQLVKEDQKYKGYYLIARHYKWALQQAFHHFNYSVAIIVEDDLDISPDFFEYFLATFPVLHSDPTLWCVSAWNDNGKDSLISRDAELLYRTDFFPGLGWMLEKDIWEELESKWPIRFWDDWMRIPEQRKDRACIRPEISRTSTFGKIGVSKGQYFEKHLKFIKHYDKFTPFTTKDLSYLIKENYDVQFVQSVYSSPLLSINDLLSGAHPQADTVRVEYTDKASFKSQAKHLGIMDDLKAGVPRVGYRGVVNLMFNGRRVYLAPPSSWKSYDMTWS